MSGKRIKQLRRAFTAATVDRPSTRTQADWRRAKALWSGLPDDVKQRNGPELAAIAAELPPGLPTPAEVSEAVRIGLRRLSGAEI